MRIVYIFRSLAIWGGIERVLVDKMNYLVSEYGYDVYMLTADQGNHPIPYQLDNRVVFHDLGIRFHQQFQYRGLRRLLAYFKLNRLFKKRLREFFQSISPYIIICATSDYVNAIVEIKGEIPMIVESHNIFNMTFGRKGFFHKIEDLKKRKSLGCAQMIVALTYSDAEDWSKYYTNVCCIPNVIHLYEGVISHDLSSKHVIFVGRFDYQKRVNDAIRIWEKVHSSYPDWTLDIFGEGELQKEIETRVESMNSIVLHRPTDKIFDYYNKSAFLIITSFFEPFGMVIPEAMSCGIPVVAFDCPYGPADIITDGVDGFLIKNRDIIAFADHVCQLIEDKELRIRMGRAAVHSAQRYRADVIMPKWKELFERLCQKE